jgi:hypothetical protein
MKIKVMAKSAVIKDMARYDGATVLSKDLVREAPDWVKDEADKEHFRLYEAVLEGEHCTTERWKSFGVFPKEL